MSATARRVAWIVLLLVVILTLVVAWRADKPERLTAVARTAAISEGVRCPTCRGQSVADSAAPAAAAIRTEIRRRVEAGETRSQIEAYLVGRYGDDILLTPPGRGVGGVVWVLPVIALGAGAGGLAVALRRWSRRPLAVATPADRLMVERASADRP